jgi:hypothetical protein
METLCVCCGARTECLCIFPVHTVNWSFNETWHLNGLQRAAWQLRFDCHALGSKGVCRYQVKEFTCIVYCMIILRWYLFCKCDTLIAVTTFYHFVVSQVLNISNIGCLYGPLWVLNTHHINLHTILQHRTEGPPVKCRQFCLCCGYVILSMRRLLQMLIQEQPKAR